MNNEPKAIILPEDLGPFAMGESKPEYKPHFTGANFMNRLTQDGVGIVNVTFEPGCRNNWHIHRAESGGGQYLLCTAGKGWFQEEGKPAKKIARGDVIHIAPGVKHWHGAAKDSWLVHLAVAIPGEGCFTEWLEPVTDAEYQNLE